MTALCGDPFDLQHSKMPHNKVQRITLWNVRSLRYGRVLGGFINLALCHFFHFGSSVEAPGISEERIPNVKESAYFFNSDNSLSIGSFYEKDDLIIKTLVCSL